MTARATPRSILITGASSGIGAALALHYASPGVTLHLGGRDAVRLQSVADECRRKGATILTTIVDVTDRAAMRDWITRTDDNTPLDLVIANAGISGGTGGGGVGSGESGDQARKIFDINVTGVLNTLEPLLPRLEARRSGQIALMSSMASFMGWSGAPAYSASKGAVRLYGEALRGALASSGVQVSVICPGFIKTPMTDANPFPMPFLMSPERAARIIVRGLARDQARIAFPWPVRAAVYALSLLPAPLHNFISRRMPAKPSHC